MIINIVNPDYTYVEIEEDAHFFGTRDESTLTIRFQIYYFEFYRGVVYDRNNFWFSTENSIFWITNNPEHLEIVQEIMNNGYAMSQLFSIIETLSEQVGYGDYSNY